MTDPAENDAHETHHCYACCDCPLPGRGPLAYDAPTYTREDMARAWQEGHMTYRRLGPDDCKCEAWNESECGCGEYGSNVITPNPYRDASADA